MKERKKKKKEKREKERKKQRKKEREIVAKALDGQRYPLPPSECIRICEGERGSGPKGADNLCFVSLKVLYWNLSFNAGCYLSLEAFLSLMTDLSLVAGI